MKRLKRSSDQILVCTPDKPSLSQLSKSLSTAGLKAIRLDSLRETVQNHHGFSFMNLPVSSINSKNKHHFIKKTLKEAQVICCTCREAASETLKGFSFFKVLIFDAHKAPESLAILPLLRRCRQLVLFGDSREPPVFTSKIVAISKGYNISLFKRLADQGLPRIALNTQYQCEASIAKLARQLFNSKTAIQAQENVVDLWLYGLKWPNFATRVLFINVKGSESLCNESLQNLE